MMNLVLMLSESQEMAEYVPDPGVKINLKK